MDMSLQKKIMMTIFNHIKEYIKELFYDGESMIYKEEIRDLFTVAEEYYLAHCISADFGMGKGIVLEFNKRIRHEAKVTK